MLDKAIGSEPAHAHAWLGCTYMMGMGRWLTAGSGARRDEKNERIHITSGGSGSSCAQSSSARSAGSARASASRISAATNTEPQHRTSCPEAGHPSAPSASAASCRPSSIEPATSHAGLASPSAARPISANSAAGVAFGCDDATATSAARREPKPRISRMTAAMSLSLLAPRITTILAPAYVVATDSTSARMAGWLCATSSSSGMRCSNEGCSSSKRAGQRAAASARAHAAGSSTSRPRAATERTSAVASAALCA
mmetsp:Transcript_6195/g.19853  ORF Transcript_6195/g.19853 Transcript_6195/m.19853 type:complete len:255 (+) Transcript_6195:122-886(+)